MFLVRLADKLTEKDVPLILQNWDVICGLSKISRRSKLLHFTDGALYILAVKNGK
jgi:hypothetical protein